MKKVTRNGLIALGLAAFAYWKYKMTPEQKSKVKEGLNNAGDKLKEEFDKAGSKIKEEFDKANVKIKEQMDKSSL